MKLSWFWFTVGWVGVALYGLMGGGEERHSSHSSGTPLQPAHTSHLLGVYKKERELRKRQSEHLPAHCQPWCLTDRGVFCYSRPLKMWKVSVVAIFCVTVVRIIHKLLVKLFEEDDA